MQRAPVREVCLTAVIIHAALITTKAREKKVDRAARHGVPTQEMQAVGGPDRENMCYLPQ